MKEYWEQEQIWLGSGLIKVRADSREVTCKFCGSVHVVKNGTTKQGTQNWLCTVCGRSFVDNRALPKGKYPIENISSALYQYYTGSSLKDIRGYLEQQTGNSPSKPTVYSWVVRFSKIAINEADKYKPTVGDTWIGDETVLDVNGRKYWLFDVIDQKTRFLLASRLTRTRATKDAALVMNEAKRRAGKSPKRILTDKAGAYVNAVDLVFGSDTQHVQSSPFVDTEDSTNIIERFQGTLKERTKVVRALKKPQTIIIEGFLVFYNYFRPHESLGGKTPSEVAKIKFPFKNWLDVVKSQSPIVKTKRLLASLPEDAEVRLPFRVPYRKRPKPKHKERKVIHQSLSIGRA